jgi:NAD(P)-dependent dehydrogenase (short-subunit alcohol dehydrogenase family)
MSSASAIVTGAGSGIGQAVATALAEAGYSVLCVDFNADAADRVAATLERAAPFALDVRDEQATDRAVAAACRLGPLTSVVTCAGANAKATAHEMELDAFRTVMDVNVAGTFLTCRAAARRMIADGTQGSMVLIGSINSVLALANQAAYATSKSAVMMLGKVLAIDWAPFGIRVNIVGPGLTRTPRAAAMIADEAKMAWAMERIPLKRVAEPKDIADVCTFLLSDQARHVTGAFLPVDGGWMTGV